MENTSEKIQIHNSSRARKIRFWILIFPLLLILTILLTLFFARSLVIKIAIEKGGQMALGTSTHVSSTRLKLFQGHLDITDLRIDNPPGFDNNPFIQLKKGRIRYKSLTIFKQPIQISDIVLEDIHLYIDKKAGQSNYEVLLENLKQSEKIGTESKDDHSKVIIDELILKNIHVSASLLPVGGRLTRSNFTINQIKLKNLGAKNKEGLSTAQVVAIITKAIFSGILQLPGNLLPDELEKGLSFAMGGVIDLGELGIDVAVWTVDGVFKMVSFTAKSLLKIGKGIGKGFLELGKNIVGYEKSSDSSHSDQSDKDP